jgi:endonuclease/exonuclease/phosphatase family metal-dependent hydrolase
MRDRNRHDEALGGPERSTVRVVTWNVGGHTPMWEQRNTLLGDAIIGVDADLVAIQEAWATPDHVQAVGLAGATGMQHAHFVETRTERSGSSGLAILSRWPLRKIDQCDLRGPDGRDGCVMRADVEGPDGALRLFNVMLDWPPNYTHVRQEQVKRLARYVAGFGHDVPSIVCGDFNAPPESDEIRMLTGLSDGCRVAWRDAWAESAREPDAGDTWSNANPLAAVAFLRSRRIDFIFSVRVDLQGRGQPLAAELLGVPGPGEEPASDHYGVVADLRYG